MDQIQASLEQINLNLAGIGFFVSLALFLIFGALCCFVATLWKD